MAFTSLKLKPASGANRIKSADDAYSFMMHMQLSYRNKPHWQAAKQALNHAGDQTIAKLGLGEPFGRRPTQKAGFWINNATIYFLILRRKPVRPSGAAVCTENPIRVYRMIESAKLAR
jgi:hypothetical protein